MVKFGKIREFVHFTSRKLLLNHMVVEKWFVKKESLQTFVFKNTNTRYNLFAQFKHKQNSMRSAVSTIINHDMKLNMNIFVHAY